MTRKSEEPCGCLRCMLVREYLRRYQEGTADQVIAEVTLGLSEIIASVPDPHLREILTNGVRGMLDREIATEVRRRMKHDPAYRIAAWSANDRSRAH